MHLRFAALLTAALTASWAASAGESDHFSLDFERAHALFAGDLDALEYFDSCAPKEPVCAMVAGTALRTRGHHARAERFYRLALEQGHAEALVGMAHLHLARKDAVEAFAWSRLAYALDDPEQELPSDDLRTLASFRALASALRELSAEDRPAADRRALEVAQRWFDDLRQPTEDTDDRDWNLEVVHRTTPEYPERLARRMVGGFVEVYAELDRDGRVVDVVALDHSHHAFTNAALTAVRKWRFELESEGTRDRFPFRQSIYFFVDST